MYHSSGNYEAFARPRKPKGVDERSAYFVGVNGALPWDPLLHELVFAFADDEYRPEPTLQAETGQRHTRSLRWDLRVRAYRL